MRDSSNLSTSEPRRQPVFVDRLIWLLGAARMATCLGPADHKGAYPNLNDVSPSPL